MLTGTVGADLSCERITVSPFGSVYFSNGMLILVVDFGSGVSGFGLGASCAPASGAAPMSSARSALDRFMATSRLVSEGNVGRCSSFGWTPLLLRGFTFGMSRVPTLTPNGQSADSDPKGIITFPQC